MEITDQYPQGMASGTIETGAYKIIALGEVSDLNTRQSQKGTLALSTYGLEATNVPTRGTGFCLTAINADDNRYGRQIAVSNVGIYSRMLNNGTFAAWVQIV